MSVSVDISWKSLNKHHEELCGDKVEVLKTDDSEIIILADGMGSGVKGQYSGHLDIQDPGNHVSKRRNPGGMCGYHQRDPSDLPGSSGSLLYLQHFTGLSQWGRLSGGI